MPIKTRKRNSLRIAIVATLLIVALAIIGARYIWYRDGNTNVADQTNITESKTPTSEASKKTSSTETEQDKGDPPIGTTEESGYLVIEEWGVKVALPEYMQGVTTYRMGEIFPDPDDNLLQAAHIMVSASVLPENECAVSPTTVGEAADIGAMYLRSEAAKPFDAERYRWEFEENILTTKQYNYHLNHVVPHCIGSAMDEVEALHAALVKLRKVEQGIEP